MSTKLRIERSKWLRGEGSMMSSLLRKRDGKMCCLGFLAIQSGYTPDEISGFGTPNNAAKATGKCLFPESICKPSSAAGFEHRGVTAELMRVNDQDILVTDAEREAKLTELFAQAGIEVEFVD